MLDEEERRSRAKMRLGISLRDQPLRKRVCTILQPDDLVEPDSAFPIY